MSLKWEHTVINALNPVELGHWWSKALGWVVVNDGLEDFEIRPAPDRLPGIIFEHVIEPKSTINRIHLDFRPEDQQAEVSRLLALGAKLTDVGQGDQSWVVLVDIEGNEFCVLKSRKKD